MTTPGPDRQFTGPLPRIYDTYLVPLIFTPYAADLVQRLAARSPRRVLETAAGTGVVTRTMASVLPESVSIVATDLNQAMLDQASARGTDRPVEWQRADATQLPFPDTSFDAVVCQFGAMFFADKAKAFSEARRVLRPGGVYLFSVWDRIEENEFAHEVTHALASLFPDDPPRFMARVPHGYHQAEIITRDLASGGFASAPEITTVTARSRADSPRIPAIAFCQGTPLRNEIEARTSAGPADALDAAEQAIARRFGAGAVDGKIQAHVVSTEAAR
jgi:SAM-dependent methyltransferase